MIPWRFIGEVYKRLFPSFGAACCAAAPRPPAPPPHTHNTTQPGAQRGTCLVIAFVLGGGT
jgi:hypothetical protein